MPTATQNQKIAGLYAAFFNRAPDQNGLNDWNTALNGGSELVDISEQFVAHPVFTAEYNGLTNQQFVEKIYVNMLGAAGDAAGIANWVAQLDAGVSKAQVVADFVSTSLTLDLDALLADGSLTQAEYDVAVQRQQTITNRADVGLAFVTKLGAASNVTSSDVDSDPAYLASIEALKGVSNTDASKAAAETKLDDAVKTGNPIFALTGQNPNSGGSASFTLTDGRDNLVGTDAADTFLGLVGQNQDGASANALSTGDRIDGGAGLDKIQASIIGDNEVDGNGTANIINARTTNVEVVELEALDNVVVDAGRMDSVEQFWSDNSAGNLGLTDVRLGSKLSVTKDITFGLKDVDAGSALAVAFDSQSLTKEGPTKADSQLLIRIADVSTETPATPLQNVNMQLSFQLGGQSYSITDLKSADGTYAGLVTALNTALDSAGLPNVEVSLGAAYNQVTFADNTVTLPFTANEVLLKDPAGAEFGQVTFEQSAIQPVTGGFLVAGNAEPFDPSTSSAMIETNLVLDNAGRGSVAGDVTIGGMSDSGASASSGKRIEKLNLTVDRDSKIGDLMSAHTMGSAGGTGTKFAFEQIEVTSGANAGDLSIADIGDANVFNASAFAGDNLTVSGDANSPEAYSYTTAASKDSVTVDVNLEASRSDNFSIDVNTQGGDDTVNYNFEGDTATNFLNTVQLSNVNVNAGAGDDTVNLNDTADFTAAAGAAPDVVAAAAASKVGYVVGDVELGAGNDAVFVANDNETKESWVFNADVSGSSYIGRGNDQYQAFGIKVKVEFQGIESQFIEVNYDTTTYKTSVEAINAAIKKAIADDAELSKLLTTTDLRDNGLQVTSKVDRDLAADALNVEFLAPKYSNNGTVDVQDDTTGNYQNDSISIFEARSVVTDKDMEAAWAAWYPGSTGIGGGSAVAPYNVGAGNAQALFNAMHDVIDSADVNSNAVDDADTDSNLNDGTIATFNKLNVAQGSDGGETAIVSINAGSGDDLIVLNTNKAAGAGYATIELSAGFGNDTIMNFNTGTTGTADVIDYTAFLDATANARASSANTIAANDMRTEQSVQYTFQNLAGAGGSAANAAVDHNKVITVKLSDLFAQLTDNAAQLPKNFEGVTAAMVQRALNAVLADDDFTGNSLGEDKQAGSQVVFNVVHDQHFEFDGTNVVMGDATDLTTQAVFTATVAYNASATGDNLSLTGVTKQGTLEFGDMYSDITDLDAASVGGTADQKKAASDLAERLDDTNGAELIAADATSNGSSYDAGALYIESGKTLSGTAANLATEVNNNTIAGTGALVVTAGAVSAADLNTIDGKSTVVVNAAAATGLTGTVAAVKAAQDSNGISGLDDKDVALSEGTQSAADLNAVIAGTSGTVTSTAALTINALDGATVAGLGGADTFEFADADKGVAITAFTNSTDKLDFTAITAKGTLAKTAVTNGSSDAKFTVDGSNTTIYVVNTDATDIGDSADANADSVGSIDFATGGATTLGEVAAFLNEGVTTSNVADEVHYFVINDDDNNNAYVYKFVDAGNNTDVDAAELTLVGSVAGSGATAVADIVVA